MPRAALAAVELCLINKETFRSASLTTFDGNDYFILGIETRSLQILLESNDSTAP